jgi:hypothetical protein
VNVTGISFCFQPQISAAFPPQVLSAPPAADHISELKKLRSFRTVSVHRCYEPLTYGEMAFPHTVQIEARALAGRIDELDERINQSPRSELPHK